MATKKRRSRGGQRQPSRRATRPLPQSAPATRASAPANVPLLAGNSGTEEGGVSVFLSYSHADDRAYSQMTKEFKHLLCHFVHAKSGRRIVTFRDQDDIKWGEPWQERLAREILGAAVFIPMLSANYLESETCRMEFNQFHTAAESLGVPELLLPVLVIDAPAIFHGSSADEIVQVACARQWEVIEDAVLSNPGSSEWKRTMARLADRFTATYQSAESALATLGVDELDDAQGSGDVNDDESALGLAELMSDFQEQVADMTKAADQMTPAIAAFGEAAKSVGELPDRPSPQDIQLWSIRLARAFDTPARQISDAGEQLFEATKAMNGTILRLRHIANEMPSELGLADSYNRMVAPLSDLGGVRQQMSDLLESMKPAEYMSVPIRKALRPARRGLTRVSDSISLIESWPGTERKH